MAQTQQPPAPEAELAAWNKRMGAVGDLPTFNRPFVGETPEETEARLKARAAATAPLSPQVGRVEP